MKCRGNRETHTLLYRHHDLIYPQKEKTKQVASVFSVELWLHITQPTTEADCWVYLCQFGNTWGLMSLKLNPPESNFHESLFSYALRHFSLWACPKWIFHNFPITSLTEKFGKVKNLTSDEPEVKAMSLHSGNLSTVSSLLQQHAEGNHSCINYGNILTASASRIVYKNKQISSRSRNQRVTVTSDVFICQIVPMSPNTHYTL